MAVCNFLAPNGEKSILYAALEQRLGEDRAIQMWNLVYSEEYKKAFPALDKDVNGEPTYTAVMQAAAPDANLANAEAAKFTGKKEFGINDFDLTSLDAFKASYNKILAAARANPLLEFSIPFNNESKFTIDGIEYVKSSLANILDVDRPSNLSFSKEMDATIANLPRNFTKGLIMEKSNPLDFDKAVMYKQMQQLFVEMRSSDGVPTGQFFDLEKQSQIVDSILSLVYSQYQKEPNATAGEHATKVLITLKNNRNIINSIAQGTPHPRLRYNVEEAAALVKDYDAVINSFYYPGQTNNFWAFALNRLSSYGITVNNDSVLESNNDTVVIQDEQGGNAAIELNLGQALRDFYDSSFELNTRDTASTRMKMFLMSIPKSTIQDEELPKEVSLTFSDNADRERILNQSKTTTFRTAELIAEKEMKVGAQYVTKINGVLFRVQVAGKLNENASTLEPENGVQAKPGDYLVTLEKYVQRKNVLSEERNFMGMTKLAPFQELFQIMTGTLANMEVSYQGYIQALLASNNPELRQVVAKLESAPQHLKNEFVAVMSTQYQPMQMVMYTKGKDGNISMHIIDSNRASEIKTLQKYWQEAQKDSDILTKNANGVTVVNKVLATELWNELQAINDTKINYPTKEERIAANKQNSQAWIALNQAARSREDQLEQRKRALIERVLQVNNIYMSPEAIDELMDPEKLIKYTQGKSLRGLFGMTLNDKPTGVISAFIAKLHIGDAENDAPLDDSENRQPFKISNPLYTENTAMTILASIQAKYTDGLFTQTHKSTEGKNIYSYGLNTALSHMVQQLKSNPDAKKIYENVPFARNAWLLDQINSGKFKLAYLDGLKNRFGTQDGATRSKMSDREQQLMALGLYQNRNNAQFGHFLSLTHSDKTTTPVFMNVQKITKLRNAETGKLNLHVLETVFKSVFMSEHDRIREHADIDIAKYESGSQLFYMLPLFNYSVMEQMVKDNELTPNEFAAIWAGKDENGRPVLSSVATTMFKPTVQKLISKQLNDMVNDTLTSWETSGLLEAGIPGSSWYGNRLLEDEGLLMMGRDWVTTDMVPLDDRDLLDMKKRAMATDFTINSFLFNTSLAQMFYGDPALVFKGNLEKTFVEYGKRLAKDIAPGRDGNFEHSPTYVTITAKDYNPLITELKGIPEYEKAVDATDAQEFVTVQEHVNVLYAYGKITQESYQKATELIKEANGGYYEFPAEWAIPMHPMKPVAAGLKAPVNGVMSYDYVKSSAIPLYPPMTRGLELDKLRTGMELTNVQRLNFSTAKKIGAPVQAIQLFDDATGKINPDVFHSNAWTGVDFTSASQSSARQVLNRTQFRIQQETPYDETKEAIRTVSQMNKLLTQGIAQVVTPFELDGMNAMNGTQLRAHKENVRKQLINLQFENFLEKIGATYNQESRTLSFKDKKTFYELLKDEAINRQGYSINDLAAIQSFVNGHTLTVPLMFTPSAGRFEGLMMSMIRNLVNVKMPGKSFVQATPAGFQTLATWEETSLDENKIVWIAPLNGDLKTVHIGEDGKVVPAQVLVPFNFFNKKGDKKLNINNFLLKKGEDGYQEGKKLINPAKLPKELLQLVGARIPNQKHSSMLPIEIAGFLPDDMGDTIIVPAALTKQMGSDFDVDKLYTYKRSYKLNGDKLEVAGNVSESKEDELKYLKNQYFDIHWSVLTNPEMLPKIVAPLDISDLADEAAEADKLLAKSKRATYYFSPSYQLADFQSMKDAKSGVGTSSLAVTNNAVIENKEITLVKAELVNGEFATVISPIIIYDRNGLPLHLTHLSGYGVSYYKGDKTKLRTKADNLVVQQNENVDNAKNRVVDRVNLNSYTAAASYAMSRLQEGDSGKVGTEGFQPGKALDLEYNTKLLLQPIVQEFVQEMAKSNDGLSGKRNINAKKAVFDALKTKYLHAAFGEGAFAVSDKDATNKLYELLGNNEIKINPEFMVKSLTMKPEGLEYNLRQIHLLNLFEKFDNVGSQLVTLQALTTQDTRGAGEDLLSALDTVDKRDKFGTDIANFHLINGLESLYADENGLTEVGTTFKATVDAAIDLYAEDLPYAKLEKLFDYVIEQSGKTELSSTVKSNIYDGMRAYAFSNASLGLWPDAYAERARLMFTLDTQKSLAQRINEAKSTWGKENYFLQRLATEIDPDNIKPHYVTYDAAKAANVDDFENNRAWLALLSSDNIEAKEIGEDLVKYAFLGGGIQSAKNFVKYIPFSYMEGTNIAPALRAIHDNIQTFAATAAFREQFFQHHPEAAKMISFNFKETGSTFEKAPDVFTLPALTDDPNFISPASALIVKVTEKNRKRDAYPDYISHRAADGKMTLYTKYKKYGDFYSGGVTYYKMDTLGNKFMNEYTHGDATGRSIVAENRNPWWSSTNPDFTKLASPSMAERLMADFNTEKVARQVGLNLKSNNYNDVVNAMHVITADEQQADHLRVMSAILSEMQRMPFESQLGTVIGAITPFSFSINQSLDSNFLGTFNPKDNRLKMSANAFTNKGKAAETLVHEMLHYHTAWSMLSLTNKEERQAMGLHPNASIVLDEMQRQMAMSPEFMDKVQAIVDIRKQALEQLKEDVIADKGELYWNARLKHVSSTFELSEKYDRLIYALHSNMEFVTHVLTNGETIAYLNSKEYSGKKTTLEAIKDAFTQFWGALVKAFGIRQNSLLEESVKRTLDLVMYQQEASFKIDKSNLPNFSSYFDDFNVKNVTSTHISGVDRIIGKLQEQLRDLQETRTGVNSLEARVEKSRQIAQTEEYISMLSADKDMLQAIEVGKQQLTWVSKIAQKTDATDNELMTAIRMANMWDGIIDLVYSDGEESVDPELSKLSGEAKGNIHRLVEKMKDYMTTSSNGLIRPSVDWEIKELQDLSAGADHVRSFTSAAKSRVLQHIGTFIENTSRHRDEEARIEIKQLHDLEKRMRAYAGNDKALQELYNKFIQQSADDTEHPWGVANQFSGKWFSFLRSTKNALIGRLAEAPGETGDKQRDIENSNARRMAWALYWAALKENSAYVNTSKFFESETGELKSSHASHLKDLENLVGKELAAEMVNKAQEQYMKYLEERNAVYDKIDSEVANKTKDVDSADKEKADYRHAYSPNNFFKKMNDEHDMVGSKYGDKFVVLYPKQSKQEFYDSNYAALQANKTEFAFFNEYKQYIEKMISYLPTTIQQNVGEAFLPIVNKSLVSASLDFEAYIKNFGENTIKSITSSEWEENMGNVKLSRIPVDFVNPNKVEVNDRSTNLARIAEVFTMMALHYKHFSEAKDVIQMGQTVIEQINKARIGGAQQTMQNGKLVTANDGLQKALQALQFLTDHSMYRKPKQLEGAGGKLFSETVDDTETFSLNPVKQAALSKRVRELIAEKEALNNKYLEQNMGLDEYEEELAKLDAELSKYEGYKLTGSKVGDKLIGINQLKALAFNPFSAVANMTFGVISVAIHANGQSDFNYSEAMSAFRIMTNATAKWVTFGTKESETAEKILNTMERLGVVGDYVDGMYGKTVDLHSNKPKWKQLLDPFGMMRSGDYFMKGLTSIAVMINRKVVVTENGVQKTISVWDALDINGNWNEAKYGKNPAMTSANVAEQSDWDKLRNRIIRVNMVLHGNQDKNSPKMLNKFILGRLLGQFRLSWLPEGFYNRFQDEKYDSFLERDVKGRYRTVADLGFGGTMKVLSRSLINLVPGVRVNPYTGILLPKGKDLSTSEVDIENMRRNLAELSFFIGLTAMIMMLKHLAADDDDKNKKINGGIRVLINMLIRGKQDIDFYASPAVFDSVTRNVIPATQVLKDYAALVRASGKLIVDEDYGYDEWLLKLTKAGLPIPEAALINKTKFMLTKDLDAMQQ